jgi:multidrug efflux system outer membrane protein
MKFEHPGSCILALVFVCALAGCVVGPNYKRPDATTIPASYAGATNGWILAQPQAQFPRDNWWEMFGDPELNSLEAQALASNQQLKAAVERFFEARDAVAQVRSELFPNLSLPASYDRDRTSPNAPSVSTGQAIGHPNTYNDFITGLDMGYEVDLWGRVRRSVESARAQLQASADDLGAVQLEIQADVAVDYFNVRALDAEEAVLNSSVEVFTKSYDLTTNRFAGGVANELEVAQSETVLENTEAQLPAVALDRARYEHALALLVGQTPATFRVTVRSLAGAPPGYSARIAFGIARAQARYFGRGAQHGRGKRKHRCRPGGLLSFCRIERTGWFRERQRRHVHILAESFLGCGTHGEPPAL